MNIIFVWYLPHHNLSTHYTSTFYNRTHLILFHLNLILWLGLEPGKYFTEIVPEDSSEIWSVEAVDDEVCGGIENHEVSEGVVGHPPPGCDVIPVVHISCSNVDWGENRQRNPTRTVSPHRSWSCWWWTPRRGPCWSWAERRGWRPERPSSSRGTGTTPAWALSYGYTESLNHEYNFAWIEEKLYKAWTIICDAMKLVFNLCKFTRTWCNL